jgi:hypothetical protein
MPEIVKTLTKIVQENKPEPMVMPAPVVMPTPTKTWNLSIVRNEDGLISNIIATRVD